MLAVPSQAPSHTNITSVSLNTKGNNSSFHSELWKSIYILLLYFIYIFLLPSELYKLFATSQAPSRINMIVISF